MPSITGRIYGRVDTIGDGDRKHDVGVEGAGGLAEFVQEIG